MKKTFVDKEIYDQAWFVDMSPVNKLVWDYITKNHSTAGIWNIDVITLKRKTGLQKVDLKNFVKECNRDYDKLTGDQVFKERVKFISGGHKLWFTGAISFQYGKDGNNFVSDKVLAVKGAITSLKEHGILDEAIEKGFITLINPSKESKSLAKGSIGVLEEEKEKEWEWEKEKENEKEKEKEDENEEENENEFSLSSQTKPIQELDVDYLVFKEASKILKQNDLVFTDERKRAIFNVRNDVNIGRSGFLQAVTNLANNNAFKHQEDKHLDYLLHKFEMKNRVTFWMSGGPPGSNQKDQSTGVRSVADEINKKVESYLAYHKTVEVDV